MVLKWRCTLNSEPPIGCRSQRLPDPPHLYGAAKVAPVSKLGSEGRGGQADGIEERGFGYVGPGIAYKAGLRDQRTAGKNRVALDAGRGGYEMVVGAGDFKSGQSGRPRNQLSASVLEPYAQTRAFHGRLAEEWAGVLDGLAIGESTSGQGLSSGDGLLVGGMNVAGIAHV